MSDTAVTVVIHGAEGWFVVLLVLATVAVAIAVAYREGKLDARHEEQMRRADKAMRR